MKYRSRRMVIEAVKWDGENLAEVEAFVFPRRVRFVRGGLTWFWLDTVCGVSHVEVGAWIYRGSDGGLRVGMEFDEAFEPAVGFWVWLRLFLLRGR